MATKPLKILHVTFNMGIGGTEQVIRQLIMAMDPKAAQHEVMCIDGQVGAIGVLLREQGVRVNSLTRAQGFDWKLIWQLRKAIRDGDLDVVHCHQYTPFIYGRLAALGTKAKVMLTEHGRFYPDRYRYKAALINPVLALITPAIVAISKATRGALARYEFMPNSRVQVIYNGIKRVKKNVGKSAEIRQSLEIPDTALVFGTVSRLDPVKNQSMMIRAFHQALGHFPDAFLLIVGDGPERLSLEMLVNDLALESRVFFTGFISEPAAYLGAMDVFLLPSFTEGTSMTLLETMSLGIPSVATEVGGTPEIVVHAESGYLVPNDQQDQFFSAMKSLAEDPGLRRKMGQNAKRIFLQRFDSSVMADKYLRLYTRITGA
jgi:glycosyltransferase involved in cell wall biosynthesis